MRDVIIVGGGLAGCCLSFELMSRSKTLWVIDDACDGAAWKASAGIINPVTGKRWNVQPGFPNLMAEASAFYARMSTALGKRLLHPYRLLRQARSPAELSAAEKTARHPGNSACITHAPRPADLPALKDADKWFEIHNAAVCDIPSLVTSWKTELQHRDALVNARFDHADLQLSPGKVAWRGCAAKNIVFCEGFRAAGNPLFQDLKITPLKGETLDLVAAPNLPPATILNRGNWLATTPDAPHLCRAGATHDLNYDTPAPTDAARELILKSLATFYEATFTIQTHQSGLRPTTPDRRPTIRQHSTHRNAYCLNGLGSKGALQTPQCVRHLADLMHRSRAADA